VLLVFLLVYFFKHPPITFFPRLAVILIFGGALGNLTDRIFFGRVTDFIAIWKFPVWNIADMGIFVGVCIILATEFFASQKNT
jgi:signal peptidase II